MADESAVQKVDLDSLDSSLVQETVSYDADANPMEAPAPVDDGTWRVKLTGASEWSSGTTKPKNGGEGRDYLKTQFQGIVLAEGTKNNNKRVFVRVNTLEFDGKGEMAYILLQIYGGKDNPEARAKLAALKNFVDLAKAFQKAIAGEPIIKVKTKWVAQYNAGTKEAPEYKTYLSGQANFPSDGKGGKQHVVAVKGAGEIAANAEVQDYFPDGN